jgi:cardiolipin synthase
MEKNDIKLLANGERAFPRILECISEATSTITINMFIWRDDVIGNEMAEAVLAAAERGVKIKIVKDKQGEVFEKSEETKQSFFHKRFNLWSSFKAKAFDIMYPSEKKAKSAIQQSNPLVSRMLSHPNIFIYKEEILNDHSKYYIFDDKILFLGGMNIEDKEMTHDVEGRPYSDYMVEMDGTEYVREFREQLMHGKPYHEPPVADFIYNIKRGDQKYFMAKPEMLKIISSAQKSLDVVMAYIGDAAVTRKIIEKARSGVKVMLILPVKANLQHDFNMKVLKKIMKKSKGSVEVYLCERMVHAKLLRIDGEMMTVGSVNLNKAAMKRMLEINVLIKHFTPEFRDTLDESITDILKESKRISGYEQLTYKKVKAFMEQIA